MRIEWKGGPLDGCVKNIQMPTATWYGPDPTDPQRKLVVYLLHSDSTYRYSQIVTDRMNREVAQRQALPSEVAGTEPGGFPDGTREDRHHPGED